MKGADDNNRILLAYNPGDRKFQLYINGAVRVDSYIAEDFAAGDWLSLIVTIDFTNNIYKLYFNATLRQMSTPALSMATLTHWSLGSRVVNEDYQSGWAFGEYAVFNRVLTAEEVAMLYARGKPLADAGALIPPASVTALRLAEMSAPSAPGANSVVIYAEDNGSGKTRLMALFSSGAAQQIAIQP